MILAGWLVLRIVYAIFFLYPLKDLLSDWQATKNLVSMFIPYYQNFFSLMMIFVMIIGAIGIGFGIYGQAAAVLLFFYCLFGILVHYRLAELAQTQSLSSSAGKEDIAHLNTAKELAKVGNLTSGQKNAVLAAVAFFFIFVGTGPLSVTALLW